jgi:plastocyanin
MALPLSTRASIALLLSAAGSLTTAGGSEISGQIQITRRLTRKRVSIATSVYQRGMTPEAAPVTGADLELTRVVVFLDARGLNAPQAAAEPIAKIEQRGRMFFPEVVAIPVGASVAFPNLDPIVHNVFSLSGAKSFDLGYYPKGQSRAVRFDRAGVVPVHCHLHPNMSAAVVVVPGPWFTRPGPNGDFALNDVPPGDHVVVVWHKSAGFFRRRVRIRSGETTHAAIEIPVHEKTESGLTRGAGQP